MAVYSSVLSAGQGSGGGPRPSLQCDEAHLSTRSGGVGARLFTHTAFWEGIHPKGEPVMAQYNTSSGRRGDSEHTVEAETWVHQ